MEFDWIWFGVQWNSSNVDIFGWFLLHSFRFHGFTKGSFGSLWGFHLIWFECVGFGLGYLNWWQTTVKRILFVKKRGFLYIVSNSINFLKREHCHQKSTKCKNAISKCPFNIHHCTGFQKTYAKFWIKKKKKNMEKYNKKVKLWGKNWKTDVKMW